jgi:hypothetical protein
MDDPFLPAHSLAEAHLYLTLSTCKTCAKGTLKRGDAKTDITPERVRLTIPTTCNACNIDAEYNFHIEPGPIGDGHDQFANQINSSNQPSRIIDLVHWLTLFRLITEAASREQDKTAARRLGYEAAECLAEALKFYTDEENELPPPNAFFHDSSKRVLRDHPEKFARTRLLAMRAKLPNLETMARQSKPVKKSWWPFKKS